MQEERRETGRLFSWSNTHLDNLSITKGASCEKVPIVKHGGEFIHLTREEVGVILLFGFVCIFVFMSSLQANYPINTACHLIRLDVKSNTTTWGSC